MNPIVKAGRDAEEEARWNLDRCFGKSRGWRVLHDLTLPDHRSSSPCQIDHVLVGRLADVIVLETKSAVQGMRLDPMTGAWTIINQGREKPIGSPVEQNIRHIEVLAHHFKENQVFPKRLGISLRPKFHNWILVQPGVSLPLVHQKAWIVQRDQIERRFEEFIDKQTQVTDLLKIMGGHELDDILRYLESFKTQVRNHVQDALPEQAPRSKYAPVPTNRKRGTFCESCAAEIESKVAAYCRFQSKRLGGKYLCRDCQKFVPK